MGRLVLVDMAGFEGREAAVERKKFRFGSIKLIPYNYIF
jgi:hypothetical protein